MNQPAKRLMLILTILTGVCATSHAQVWREEARIKELFDDAGIDGTFVALDSETNELVGHNENHARTQHVPASTYKIPHALIGLATHAVESVDEMLPYGGRPQPYPTWEHDMPLAEAITLSAVPIYQQLAMRIGPRRMKQHLARIKFGTEEIGSDVTRFWLDGPLRISPIEQTLFLNRLAHERLPYPVDMQRSVARIARVESNSNYSLHAKTGWAFLESGEYGWWVGWVRSKSRIVSFALHMRMRAASDGPVRIALGKECLRALSVIDQENPDL